MKIGLISDTHIPEAGELPQQIKELFAGVELILHAGDLHILSVLDWLEEVAPVMAVRGNGDTRCDPDPRMKRSQVLTVDGLRIGMVHGLALPEEPPWRTFEKIMEREFGGPVDIFVHGDTHVAGIDNFRGVLLVNPGSPTFPNNLVNVPGTVGFLEIVQGKFSASLVQLGNPPQVLPRSGIEPRPVPRPRPFIR